MGGSGKGGGGYKPSELETMAGDIFKNQNDLWAPILGATGQGGGGGQSTYWRWVPDGTLAAGDDKTNIGMDFGGNGMDMNSNQNRNQLNSWDPDSFYDA